MSEMEKSPSLPSPQSLHAEAFRLALDEPEPVSRLVRLTAAVAAGVTDAIMPALETFYTLPPYDDGPERTLPETYSSQAHTMPATTAGYELLKAITDQRQFAAAESIVEYIHRTDPGYALSGVTYMMRAGHYGRDNRFLSLDVSSYLKRPLVWYDFDAQKYMEGLAYTGHNVFLDHSPVHEALSLLHKGTPTPGWEDEVLLAVAEAYVQGGHTDMAASVRDRLHDPMHKALVEVALAKATGDGTPGQSMAHIEQILSYADAVEQSENSYGRRHFLPQQDAIRLRAVAGVLLAERGDTDRATMLAGDEVYDEPDCMVAGEQGLIHAYTYRKTGDLAARDRTIATIKEASSAREELSGQCIRLLAEGDLLHRQTIPSEHDDIPLIFYELPDLFGGESIASQAIRIMADIQVDDDQVKRGQSRRTREITDLARATVAGVLAEHGAIQNAKDIADAIPDPVIHTKAVLLSAAGLERYSAGQHAAARQLGESAPDGNRLPGLIGVLVGHVLELDEALLVAVDIPRAQNAIEQLADALAGSGDTDSRTLVADLRETVHNGMASIDALRTAASLLKQYVYDISGIKLPD